MIHDDGSVPIPNDDTADLQTRVAAELKSGKAEGDIILDLIRDGSVRIVPEAEALISRAKGASSQTAKEASRSASGQRETGATASAPSSRRGGNRARYLMRIAGTLAVLAVLYLFGGSHGTSFIFIPLVIGLRFFGMSNRGGRGGGGGPWTVKMPPSSSPQQTSTAPLPPDHAESLDGEPRETLV